MHSSQLQRPYLPFATSDPETESLRSFNPKRISEAAARPLPPRPKMTAPYIQLDLQHRPIDRVPQGSYAKVSKKMIKAMRISTIVLRILQLVGAMGLLVCMLFVRKIDEITGWICRVPPAVAIFHIVYSIYHLSGSYRVRTPSSTVGYYLFASTIDLAIISFYSFIAVLSWRQHSLGTEMDWATIFTKDGSDEKIILAVFLDACVSGGLTIISMVFSVYLILTFRRLANLSPDMNPFLEPKGSLTRKPAKRISTSTIATQQSIPFAATRHPRPVDVPSPRDSTRFSYPQAASTASPRASMMSEAPRYSAISLNDSPRNSHDIPRYSQIESPKSSPRSNKKKTYAPLQVNSPKRSSGLRDSRATSANLGADNESEWRYRKPSAGDSRD
ncbi:hypothetical protein L873DRAFT_1673505 [Choiromyces venosus 120613-1]|uniref:Uncharacterized protein n=1 Tax=Choiromyces venosus 120613-1 TaxID=1336337 RepID=A0A3N4JW76_9PEZI|nr:hypothetical protein L873DRAFT_1673505 [Choiromyces venosus 120613-1]